MSEIFNCKSDGNMQSNTTSIGGIVGNSSRTQIEYCINEATVESSLYHIGGIVGNSAHSNLKKCVNLGEIKGGTSGSSLSGIIGQAWDSAVEECYNIGKISGQSYVAGIVGNLEETTIKNCYNQGDITANFTSGGIVGQALEGSVTNCYNSGNSLYGIIGIVRDTVKGMIKIDNCYYLNTNISKGENIVEGYEEFVSGSSIGKTIDDMTSSEFVELLNNKSNVWKQEQNSLPILSWQ